MANLPCLTSAPMGQVQGFVWRFRTMFSKPNRSRSSSRPVGSNGPLYQQTMSGCCSCPGSRTSSRSSTKPSGPPTCASKSGLLSPRCHDPGPPFTVSFSVFPALNLGEVDAEIETASPVFGSPPVPGMAVNPGVLTGSRPPHS